MKLSFKILLHFIYWLVFLSLDLAMGSHRNGGIGWTDSLFGILWDFGWGVVVFYSFYLHLSGYYEQGKIFRYFIVSVISASAFGVLVFICYRFLNSEVGLVLNWVNWSVFAMGSFVISQCGTLVRGFENWTDSVRNEKELVNQNLNNELEMLKQQINPHFLFNSLNNIDSLIHKSPESASKSLNGLAQILRYMIYETNVSEVPLNKELDHIQNYVDLQLLRFWNPASVKCNLAVSDETVSIAPMLFLPFVENAFKYAVIQGRIPAVEIEVVCDETTLHFNCINSYRSGKPALDSQGGVGLANVKQRLQLIYPNKHKLNIWRKEDLFTVNLELDLR